MRRWRFNPRPPLLASEPPQYSPQTNAAMVFQSTPAITGERARPTSGMQRQTVSFNPRPPLLASEPYLTRSECRRPSSFNPRPPLLASEPLLAVVVAFGVGRFNPRPPLLASEPSYRATTQGRQVVSIHARHYWRASRCNLRIDRRSEHVSIHARHYWRASPWVFVCNARRRPVSIHARHYWRASRCGTLGWSSPPMFQSTPAITGERAGGMPAAEAREMAFQSTPAITGERADPCQ